MQRTPDKDDPNLKLQQRGTQALKGASLVDKDAPQKPGSNLQAAQLKPQGQSTTQRAMRIKAALLDGWTEDEQAALEALRGLSVEELSELRGKYAVVSGGRALERDFKQLASEEEANEALTILWFSLSLQERLKAQVNEGWLWNTENERSMLDILRTASDHEIQDAAKNPAILALLEESLGGDDLYTARNLLYAGQGQNPKLLEAVLERIQNANGYVNDDENAVYNILLELNAAQRRTIWEEHKDVFSFLSSGELKVVEDMCTGSQADALKARMREATEGMGTNEDAVELVATRTGEAAQREARIKTLLTRGVDEDRQPLTDARRAALTAELQDLGSIQGGLLRIERKPDGKIANNPFLDMLRGDVGDTEFQNLIEVMGADEYEVARQRILDALGIFDDEEAIYAVLEKLPEELRKRISSDSIVLKALQQNFSSQEFDTAHKFRTGKTFEMAVHKLENALGGITTDELNIIKIVANMSAEDRVQLKKHPVWQEIMGSWSLNEREKEILRETAATGRLPTDLSLEYAVGTKEENGDVTGGEGGTEMLESIFAHMPPEERILFRVGFWLKREGATPKQARQHEALEKYEKLEARLQDTLGADEFQAKLDMILGTPTPAEIKTEDGRMMAADIMARRIDDKQAMDEGLAAAFTNTDEAADNAAIQFKALYRRAKEDGSLTKAELAMLGALSAQFHTRHEEHVDASNTVARMAGTLASIAAGIVVTIATGGAAGPLVGAALAKAAVSGAVVGAVARMGTSELMGGDHYDATRIEEGGVDALAGALDGAMSLLSAGLASRFTQLIGLQKAELAGEAAKVVHTSTKQALAFTGKKIGTGAATGAIEGFISGAMGEIVLTAADRLTWEQNVWSTISRIGMGMIKGGALASRGAAAAAGGLGAVRSLVNQTSLTSARQTLLRAGLDKADFTGLSPAALKHLAVARQAALEGRPLAAESALNAMQTHVPPQTLVELRQRIFQPLKKAEQDFLFDGAHNTTQMHA